MRGYLKVQKGITSSSYNVSEEFSSGNNNNNNNNNNECEDNIIYRYNDDPNRDCAT
jgi:hypothetical protein